MKYLENNKVKNLIICAFIVVILLFIYTAINYNQVETVYNEGLETINKSNDMEIVIGGEAAGIKLLASGVLVMGFDSIETAIGVISPAYGVNIQIGDVILQVNGNKIETNKELMTYSEQCEGKELTLKINRQGKEFDILIQPAKSNLDGKYKLGLWVKDSSAGVGTITFYDRKNMTFAALGHGITETKENYILPIVAGGLVKTNIIAINKGEPKKPGDLRGTLTTDLLAQINLNTEYGIYGKMESLEGVSNKKTVDILPKNKIKEGNAKIYCTLNGNTVEEFDIKIERVLLNSTSNKNMVIKVTDKDLLERTGGIVQGMSGSPIVQNGKLVGAVTHVFLNDPTKGYGVFIEKMLNDVIKVGE